MITPDTAHEAVQASEARRRELFIAGRNAEATRRYELADQCRAARVLLEFAINSELADHQPPGLGTWERLA